LTETGKRNAVARLERFDAVERESPLAPALALAVLATDAMDYAVRKAVELGVAKIEPVIAERSQRFVAADKAGKRLAHWRAIAIAACEQCGRNRVPAVDAPRPLAEWLDQARGGNRIAMAAPGATESLAAFARRAHPRHVLIGPEGGLTEGEVSQAVANGATPVHLGPRILRAETAAVAALAMLAAVLGDAR
jgi:16S rRNA (uracil1498-N3)-methyltransferase